MYKQYANAAPYGTCVWPERIRLNKPTAPLIRRDDASVLGHGGKGVPDEARAV